MRSIDRGMRDQAQEESPNLQCFTARRLSMCVASLFALLLFAMFSPAVATTPEVRARTSCLSSRIEARQHSISARNIQAAMAFDRAEENERLCSFFRRTIEH